MSTCEHKGPGPCPICEHVEQASIPSSPILDFEKARSSASIGPHGEIHPDIEEHILEAQAQAAVSPLLAEIEALRIESAALRGFNERWQADCNAAWAEAQKLREALEHIERRADRWRECQDVARKALGGS